MSDHPVNSNAQGQYKSDELPFQAWPTLTHETSCARLLPDLRQLSRWGRLCSLIDRQRFRHPFFELLDARAVTGVGGEKFGLFI